MLRAKVVRSERETIKKLKLLGFVAPGNETGGKDDIMMLSRVIPLDDGALGLIQKELGSTVTFERS